MTWIVVFKMLYEGKLNIKELNSNHHLFISNDVGRRYTDLHIFIAYKNPQKKRTVAEKAN